MTNMQIVEIDVHPDTTEILLRLRRAQAVVGKGAFGIDVSRWQREVNWDAMAAAGVRFAYIRVTMGITGLDQYFERNQREAKRVGIARGYYHYFINSLPGLPQVANFTGAWKNDPGEMPPVCDVEPRDVSPDPNVTVYETINRTANTEQIKAFLDGLETASGVRPLIYTNKFAWDYCTTVPGWSNSYKLWHAQYTTAPAPKINLPWTECQIWQYSRTGNIGGTSPLDLNRYGVYP